jgi:hypothetical protein
MTTVGLRIQGRCCVGLITVTSPSHCHVPARSGYGMITNQPIKKGQKLVNVPRKLWMTSRTARESPICGEMIRKHDMDSWKVGGCSPPAN